MKTYIINSTYLEAVHLASGKDSTRYINGVCVEPLADGTCALAATDGNRFAGIGCDLKGKPPEDTFIMASDDIKKVIAAMKAEKKVIGKSLVKYLRLQVVKEPSRERTAMTVNIVLMQDNDDNAEVLRTCVSFTTKAIDGNFPDYRRVITEKVKEKVEGDLCFDMSLAADFGTMAKLLGSDCQKVKFESGGPDNPIRIIIEACSGFIGVLMPMRY